VISRKTFVPAILLALAVALPFVAPTYYVQFASKVLIMGTLAMALNFVVGFGGLVSLCHAALFGLAGYALALLTPKYDVASFWLTFPVAVAASSFAALIIGTLALRTRGVYFIMVTLAFGEMLFYLFHDSKLAGGSDGAFIYTKPSLDIFSLKLFDLDKPFVFYFVVLAICVITVALLTMIVHAPFGRALAAARDNERRARALGFPIFRIQLTAFTLSGALAGAAGYFSAAQFGFIAPQTLGWHVSAIALVMVLIGGLRSVTGPLIGALVLLGLEEVLKATTENWKLAEGLIIIGIVLTMPHGVRQVWAMLFPDSSAPVIARRASDKAIQSPHPNPPSYAGEGREGELLRRDALRNDDKIALRATSLQKHFGGVAAVSGVSLELRVGEIHALIGPNGAGKSTLINLLSGDLVADGGTLVLGADDIMRLRADQRARAGLARSYQTTTIFRDLSGLDNVRLAAQAQSASPLKLCSNRCSDSIISQRACDALNKAGLSSRAHLPAKTLSHGEQRQLEIAMVLATQPRVILLDEPLAGMGRAEAQRMVGLIASLKQNRAVLIVEHDMDAVFKLADRLTVMASGKVIASGSPQDVRNDPAVRIAYLGV
jgi:branched-chain amino acid transport system permease protein